MAILIADVAIIDNGKVLLVQQRKQSAYGLWSLPGGHIEAGETPEEAVIREVREELGVALQHAKPFKVYLRKTPTGELEINTFSGELAGPFTLKDDELMAYGWFSLESLQTMREALRPVVLEQAQDALRDLPASR
jgi:8-oxo-dGTP diphosphatase